MPRLPRRSVLAASILVPFIAGCSGRDAAPSTADAGSTSVPTTVTTVAATPGATSPAEQPHSSIVATVAPSYADAERAFHRGRYEEAASMFEVYTSSNPDNAWGQYMLGLSAWKVGNHTRALEAFDAALRLDPRHRKSLLNSARVLLETSRSQDALDRIEQALAIEPLSGEGLRLLGRAQHELGRIPEAIDAYQRAIAIDDHDVWAMNNLGHLYIEQGRTDAALLPLARAVELRGNVPVFQNNLGTALERTGHPGEATRAYEAALEADSTYTKAAVALDRVKGRIAAGDSPTLDLTALSREFQTQVEEWRSRVRVDSTATDTATPDTTVADSTVVDSTGVTH
jgi:predicted Zn-dependent protease